MECGRPFRLPPGYWLGPDSRRRAPGTCRLPELQHSWRCARLCLESWPSVFRWPSSCTSFPSGNWSHIEVGTNPAQWATNGRLSNRENAGCRRQRSEKQWTPIPYLLEGGRPVVEGRATVAVRVNLPPSQSLSDETQRRALQARERRGSTGSATVTRRTAPTLCSAAAGRCHT